MKKDGVPRDRNSPGQSGLDVDESQSVHPSDTTETLKSAESGYVSWGDLQLIEQLGKGGFATVYRAWDPTLQREVALKLLQSSSTDTITQKERILDEGRLLARIRHQNVATVHGVAEHDGLVGLWMELVRGKSLEELLRANGPFGARECIGIGIEVADALRAVHGAGLAHGDISAKNVMREEGGRIVLVDLGLGARCSEATSTKEPWRIAGTPAYMAPEMLRGTRPSVTTDVYALGMLLYHLLTSQYPAQGQGLWRRTGEGRGLQSWFLRDQRSDVPEALCRVVERALAPDPADRFQSVGAFQVALERCGRLNEIGPERARPTAWLIVAVISLLAVSGLLVISYFGWRSLPQASEGSTVVLADIANRTSDTQLEGVTSLLRSQLSQAASLDLLEESVIREVLQRMALPAQAPLTEQTAREVAWREGVPLVVAGELSPLGKSYVLNLQVVKIGDGPDSAERTWTKSFRARDKSYIFEVIDEGGAWVRTVVEKTPIAGEPKTLPSRDATTASWEALSAFTKAEHLQEKDKLDDAILLFQEAVRIDPDFALAHMRLGDILISLGRHREGYEAWQRARHTVRSVRLTRKEELRIGGVYAYDTNDFKQAESIFHTFSLQYPNDYYPFFLHAFALRAEGRYEEAIKEIEQAATRRPSLFHIPAQLARTWMLMGRIDLAERQAERLRQMGQAEWALVMDGSCRFLQQDFVAAETTFRQIVGSTNPEWRSDGYTLLASMLSEVGRFDEARKILEQGIQHDSRYEMSSRKADKLIAKAYLFHRRSDAGACRTACLEALKLEAGPLRLARVGTLLATSGFPREAEQLLTTLSKEPDLPVYRLAKNRIRGEVYLAHALYPQALALFREAAQLEPFYATKEYLARALAASGNEKEALDQYLIIKNSPARFWQTPEAEFPGQYADSVLRCAEIAEGLNKPGLSEVARNLYRKLRPSDRPETANR